MGGSIFPKHFSSCEKCCQQCFIVIVVKPKSSKQGDEWQIGFRSQLLRHLSTME